MLICVFYRPRDSGWSALEYFVLFLSYAWVLEVGYVPFLDHIFIDVGYVLSRCDVIQPIAMFQRYRASCLTAEHGSAGNYAGLSSLRQQ